MDYLAAAQKRGLGDPGTLVDYAGLGFFMRTALLLFHIIVLHALVCGYSIPVGRAAEPGGEGISSREAKASAKRSIPFQRLNQNASQLVREVVENPSFFRRMPPQEIECNPEMFTFLVRRPEVMVNIWELMGITQVSTQRTSPFTFVAHDGVGTTAKCDLIYGDENLHIYYGTGDYDGSLTPRKVTGRCVCILQSRTASDDAGGSAIAGTMDVFLKLDNLGADLLTRTLAPLVGKTADYNFIETAKFISQISQICINNPAAAQELASQLGNVDGAVRQEFASIAAKIATLQQMPAGEAAGAPIPPIAAPVASGSDQPGQRPSASDSQPDYGPLQLSSSGLTPSPPTAILPKKSSIYMRR